tara:strand:- start:12 stop:647 length:636 start_codon:yes stop_codon:yes gene_type:complete
MATRWDNLPGLTDDVVARDREDTAKGKKGREVDSSKLKGSAKEAVREAGQRAENRKVGRRGAGIAAFEIGYGVGREIDEKTGLGKKMVEKSGLGSAAEKAANRRDKVELSKDAKARLDEEEVDNYRRETDANEKARREYSGRYEDGTRLPDEESYKGDGMKKGGMTAKFMSFSKKGKPAGMKPVTKMASGGSFRASANGIAQKGKTRGKMC